jgi:hypothetical protein
LFETVIKISSRLVKWMTTNKKNWLYMCTKDS